MSKRIEKVKESPCFNCGLDELCDYKISRNKSFREIKDMVFWDKEFLYKDCPLYISLTVGDIVDE